MRNDARLFSSLMVEPKSGQMMKIVVTFAAVHIDAEGRKCSRVGRDDVNYNITLLSWMSNDCLSATGASHEEDLTISVRVMQIADSDVEE